MSPWTHCTNWTNVPMSTPQNCHSQCPCPHSESQTPPASSGDPPILAGKPNSVSYEVPIFNLCLSIHKILCVPSNRGVSVSSSPV